MVGSDMQCISGESFPWLTVKRAAWNHNRVGPSPVELCARGAQRGCDPLPTLTPETDTVVGSGQKHPSGRETGAVKSTARKTSGDMRLGGAAAIAGLLLAGCSTTAVPINASAPSAYSTTSVRPSAPARTQPKKSRVVTASRYDRGLAGNCTSNGESYDPKSLTAASRTLPAGFDGESDERV
jgi:hypothetical protein